MAKLIEGSRSSVFVTHVEFSGNSCQIFCQVGNVGSQADTVAERVADCIENGASQTSNLSTGGICLALFHEDNSWYRARVVKDNGPSVEVFFIDYGNTETVIIENTREAPEYVLAIPALSTKCVIDGCSPLSGSWSDAEKLKLQTMLHSGEFTIEVSSVGDASNPHYRVKLFSLDAPNTPIFVKPAASSEQSLPHQNLQVGSQYEVFIAYVESSNKFYVQMKAMESELNSLMSDIAACFAEDLPSTGDVVSAVRGQVCASCFSEDGAFYRAVVQSIHGNECTVLYVDYGNHEKKSTSELFTLPQALCKLPIQAIQCSYKVDGRTLSSIEDKLHDLTTSDIAQIMTVLSGNSREGFSVKIESVEQLFGSTAKPTKPTSAQSQGTTSSNKLWKGYAPVIMQVDGIYDVCVSHVEHPGSFYIQLVANATNLDTVMQGIDEVAHNYDRLSNCFAGYPCLAKFSDNVWYRGEIIGVDKSNVSVAAVDFGFIENFTPSQLKNTDPVFKELPAQAIRCSIDSSKEHVNSWSGEDISKFKKMTHKIPLVAKCSGKKGIVYQLDLFETQSEKDMCINNEFHSSSAQSKTSIPIARPQQTSMQQQHQSAPPVRQSTPEPSIPAPDISIGSKVTLCITALKWPIVFGQLTHTPVNKVAKLQTDLNTYFDSAARESLSSAGVGNVCCTQYVDGGWYRGMVTSAQGGRLEVTFIDFGDGVTKISSDLKKLPANLCELPQQCIQCLLDNVPSSTATDMLEKVLVNNRVEMQLLRKGDGVFATYHVEVGRNVLEKLQGSSSQGAFGRGQSNRGFGGASRAPREDSSNMRRAPSGDSGFKHQEVAVGGTQEIMVTYVKDPSHFQVVLDKMSGSLDTVMDQLHEYYDKLAPNADQLENPRLGQPCVAQFSEDKGWYRAIVTGLKASGPAEVMFVDYGNNEYTDREALKTLKPEFMSLPAQAVTCSLAGVGPSQQFWNPEHIVQFEEMVVEQCFSATILSQNQEDGQLVYKVDLVDKAGTKVNQKFGSMTGTQREEPAPRTMSGNRITISNTSNDSGWDDSGDGGRSFGGSRGGGGDRGSSGFGGGSRGPSGFGSKDKGSSGFGGGDRGSGGGFGGGDRGSGGGFGGGDRGSGGGFGGGDRGSGGGFGGGDRGSGGGFGGNKGSGGFGGGDRSSGGGFGGGSSGFGGGDRGSSGFGGGDRGGRGFGGGGGGGSRDCFKCGESGHISRECPNPPKAGGGGGNRDCFKCGESGHISRECPNAQARGRGGGGSSECYKCGETGHFARECPNAQVPGGSRGFGGRDGGSGGGFNKGGGFGSRGGTNESNEDWGDGSSRGGGGGGFGSQGGSGGGGFGSRGSGGFGGKSESGPRGGGFGGRSDSGGGFGNRGGGGFGQKSDGGSSGGFGGRGGGFGSQKGGGDGGGSDDWETEAAPAPPVQTTGAGDGTTTVSRFRGVSSAGVAEISKIQSYTPLTMDIRETADVYVVYTAKPDQFWCQLIKNSTNLEKLMEDVNHAYSSLAAGDMPLQNAVVGAACAAKFSEDSTWYRARIVKLTGSEAEVMFVDYGNSEKVSTASLKHLKSEFMSMKAQGIKCGLDGVLPTNGVWTDKSVEDFEDMTVDKHLVAKVVGNQGDAYQVDLENVDEKQNVGEAMCDKGHCAFVSAAKASPTKVQKVDNPFPLAKLPVGEEIDAYVSWIDNPERFWIQPVSGEASLTQLVEKVQELYTSGAGKDLKVQNLVTGQAVVSIFSEDEAWYRAYVEQARGSVCNVRFVDYGNSDKANTESLRLPTEDLFKAPSEAAVCSLSGIRPLQTGVWTSDAKDIMESLVTDKVVKCKVLEETDGGYSVEIRFDGSDIAKELIKTAVVRAEREQPQPGKPSAQNSAPIQVLHFQEPVALNIGCTEDAYITQTDSVASFWCQLSKFYDQLLDVMSKLDKFCKSGTQVPEFPIDMACGAKFSADNSWYRARISANYPDSVEVLFVDYGNSEKVDKCDICLLNEELVELPPQAVQCEMQITGQASNQLTNKFIELTRDQEVHISIMDIQEGIPIVKMKLDDGRSVSDELGLTTPSAEPTVSPQTAPVQSAVSLQRPPVQTASLSQSYPKPAVPAAPTNVYITQVNSPDNFYIQRVDEETRLNEIMEKIAEIYGGQDDSLKLDSVSVGQACCGKFSEDEAWYRAEVVNADQSGVKIRFIDYGNSEETGIENVMKATAELLQVPPFAVQCRLAGVLPQDGAWSEAASGKFIELTADKELTCTFVSSFEVQLTCDDQDVGNTLIESQLAVQSGSQQVNGSVYTSKSYPSQNVPADSAACYVSHVDTQVYIQLASEEETLNTLTENIQSLETDPPLSLSSVKPGDAVGARFSEDGSWYRAVITSTSDSSVDVRFVDYGNCDTVTKAADLRELSDKQLTPPPLAYVCSLHGHKTLDTEQGEIIVAATADKEVTVKFLSKAKVFDVELLNDAGENLVSLLPVGNAGEDKEESEAVEETIETETDVSTEATPTEPVVNGHAEPTECNVDVTNIVKSVEELQHQTLTDGQRVQVTVAHVNSPSEFWVHVESESPKLDGLLNTMFDFYGTEAGEKLGVSSVDKGAVVAALYAEDESWYRAKVVESGTEGITVEFLDHGNCETVTTDSLRSLPAEFAQLPIQGIKCKLGGVQPTYDSWSDEAIETFTQLTNEKSLLLDVGGMNDKGVYTVQLLDMGIPVSELLLKKDIGAETATPVAVSTKVKQVFSPADADVIAKLYDVKASDKVGPFGYKLRDLTWLDNDLVSLTVVNSPHDIWCQLQDNSYEYFQDKLNSAYSKQATPLSNFKEGGKCVVKLEEGEYMRASILWLQADSAEIKLVDKGSVMCVQLSDLYTLEPDFCEQPQLAFPCKLPNLQPVESSSWNQEVCKAFKDMILELSGMKDLPASAKATTVLEENGKLQVELDIDRQCLARALVQKELARFIDPVEATVDDDEDTESSCDIFGAFKHVRLDTDSEHSVTLIDCDSLDQLVFHTKASIEVLEDMAGQIAEFAANQSDDGCVATEVGSTVLAKCPDDDLWYRAVIKKNNGETHQVYLVDYGSTYGLPAANLLPLPPTLLETPAQAILACLDEIEPMDETWSEDCMHFFEENYHGKEFYIYIGGYGKGIHRVLVTEEAGKSSTINKHLVELDLAAPVLGSQMDYSILGEQAEMSFHELSMSRQDSFGSTIDEADTSCLLDTTEADTTGVTDADTSHVSDATGDTSVSTLDGQSDENTEETGSKSAKGKLETSDSLHGDHIEQDSSEATEKACQIENEVSSHVEVHSSDKDPNETDISTVDTGEAKGDEVYSTTDVDPRSTEESDLDESYRPFALAYSPTGYTTSELETSDLQTLDSTGYSDFDTTGDLVDTTTDVDTTGVSDYNVTSEIDTTGLTDYDTTGLTDYDTTGLDDIDTSGLIDTTDTAYSDENNADISDDTADTIATDVDTVTQLDKPSEASNEPQEIISKDLRDKRKYEADINSNIVKEKVTKGKKDDNVNEMNEGSNQNEKGGIDSETLQLVEKYLKSGYPSMSDSTYPSSLTSMGDDTFTSVCDTSQTDSIFCEHCKCDISSCLDTTGCESEFSYIVCPDCEGTCSQLQNPTNNTANKNQAETDEVSVNRNVRMMEVAGDVSDDAQQEKGQDTTDVLDSEEKCVSDISQKEIVQATADVSDDAQQEKGLATADVNVDSKEKCVSDDAQKEIGQATAGDVSDDAQKTIGQATAGDVSDDAQKEIGQATAGDLSDDAQKEIGQATADVSDDSQKTIGQATIGDVSHDSQKTIGQATVGDVSDDAQKEIGQATIGDVSHDSQKTIGQATIGDVSDDAQKEIGQAPAGDVSDDAQKTIGQATIGDVSDDAQKEIGQATAGDLSDDAQKEIGQATADVSDDSQKTIGQATIGDVSDDAQKEIWQATIGDVSDDAQEKGQATAGDVSDDAQKTIGQATIGDVSDDAQKEKGQATAGDVSDDAQKEIWQATIGDVSDDAQEKGQATAGDVSDDAQKEIWQATIGDVSDDAQEKGQATAGDVSDDAQKTIGQATIGDVSDDAQKEKGQATAGDVSDDAQKEIWQATIGDVSDDAQEKGQATAGDVSDDAQKEIWQATIGDVSDDAHQKAGENTADIIMNSKETCVDDISVDRTDTTEKEDYSECTEKSGKEEEEQEKSKSFFGKFFSLLKGSPKKGSPKKCNGNRSNNAVEGEEGSVGGASVMHSEVSLAINDLIEKIDVNEGVVEFLLDEIIADATKQPESSSVDQNTETNTYDCQNSLEQPSEKISAEAVDTNHDIEMKVDNEDLSKELGSWDKKDESSIKETVDVIEKISPEGSKLYRENCEGPVSDESYPASIKSEESFNEENATENSLVESKDATESLVKADSSKVIEDADVESICESLENISLESKESNESLTEVSETKEGTPADDVDEEKTCNASENILLENEKCPTESHELTVEHVDEQKVVETPGNIPLESETCQTESQETMNSIEASENTEANFCETSESIPVEREESMKSEETTASPKVLESQPKEDQDVEGVGDMPVDFTESQETVVSLKAPEDQLNEVSGERIADSPDESGGSVVDVDVFKDTTDKEETCTPADCLDGDKQDDQLEVKGDKSIPEVDGADNEKQEKTDSGASEASANSDEVKDRPASDDNKIDKVTDDSETNNSTASDDSVDKGADGDKVVEKYSEKDSEKDCNDEDKDDFEDAVDSVVDKTKESVSEDADKTEDNEFFDVAESDNAD